MKNGICIGQVRHQRTIPKAHDFSYPMFMWLLNLDMITEVADIRPWFSTTSRALSRFNRSDYFGDQEEPLADSVKQEMQRRTGRQVEAEVYGLLNLRTLGLYFSPVNFYFGCDHAGTVSHFLAEVANIPWNERHLYAHLLTEGAGFCQPKEFHVSPFNDERQHYHWNIELGQSTFDITIAIADDRGDVFKAELQLTNYALDRSTIRRQLIRRPVMTASIVGSIYWQALKLYLKGVPYVPYQRKELS